VNAREEQNNSHAIIKFSCCQLQDETKIISHHAINSSANTQRSGTASTPKIAREYVQDGMYVAKGKYGKYLKEAAFVNEGNNEPLATRAICCVHCAR
jgi:hypothetical protein